MAYSTVANVRSMSKIASGAVSDADVTTFIGWADAEIDKRTGKSWSSSNSKTDYFDTSEAQVNRDWDDETGLVTPSTPYFMEHNSFKLTRSPVLSISNVWILDRGADIGSLLSYDSGASSYTDNTTEANSVRGTPFYAFAETVGVGDIMYVGLSYRFLGITISLSTAGSGGVLTWEYYDGSSWSALSGVAESASGADDLNASGKVSWSLPEDWQDTSVDGNTLYWVRARVTTAHSTSPKVNGVVPDRDSVISDEVSSGSYDWNSGGRLVLKDDFLTDEYSGLRVDYTYGASSTPTVVETLSAVLASKWCLESLMSGSYDDVSRYRVGDIEVSKGEPYTNLRAAIIELEKKEEVLWKELGFRNVMLIS